MHRALGMVAMIFLLASADGCTRCFFRNAADKEVNDILAEQDRGLPWKITEWHVYPDSRARFADPTNPDRPPMPPDDPTTDQLAPHPQQPGHAGVARIEGTGYVEIVKVWDTANRDERKSAGSAGKAGPESPESPERAPELPEISDAEFLRNGPVQKLMDVPLNETEGFLLTLDQSMELGLINAREYQSFREDLYLAALPVTQQRFSFAFQWEATQTAIRQWAGIGSLEGQQNNWTLNSTVGFSKLFSTGALLTTAFANNTVWNFMAPAGQHLTSQSTLNLDFVQPLLQGGGKAVTLEPLTQAERNLLYSIRAYARFRELFYLEIALGNSLPANLPALAGANSVGTPISVLAALGIASTDVSGGFVGYLSTLFRELDMAVDTKLVRDLETALKIFEGYQEGGLFSPLQVDQVRSTLLQAKNNVLNDNQLFTNAVDQFKLLLGAGELAAGPRRYAGRADHAPVRPLLRSHGRLGCRLQARGKAGPAGAREAA